MARAGGDEEMVEVRQSFASFDRRGSGKVDAVALGVMLRSMDENITDHDVKHIVTRFSSDGHNISMDDFSKMMHSRDEEMGGVSEEVEIEDAFKVFDKDNDHSVSGKELELVLRALGEEIDLDLLQTMIRTVGNKGDGTINFEEFKKLMTDGPPR